VLLSFLADSDFMLLDTLELGEEEWQAECVESSETDDMVTKDFECFDASLSFDLDKIEPLRLTVPSDIRSDMEETEMPDGCLHMHGDPLTCCA
jgi:hypothetical protein